MEREQRDAMDAIHADMDPTAGLCGISTLWALPASHPFNEACRWHDVQYDLARKGLIKGESSDAVDYEFWEKLQAVAGNDPLLLSEAALFFALCQTWGRYRWPEAARE